MKTTSFKDVGCNSYFEEAYNKTNMIQHLPGDACFKAYPQINTPIVRILDMTDWKLLPKIACVRALLMKRLTIELIF